MITLEIMNIVWLNITRIILGTILKLIVRYMVLSKTGTLLVNHITNVLKAIKEKLLQLIK